MSSSNWRGWWGDRYRRFQESGFYREMAAARQIIREQGFWKGSRHIAAGRWRVVRAVAAPRNWKLLKKHEVLMALIGLRVGLTTLFYMIALIGCLVASPVLFSLGRPGWALAAAAFALYSLQAIPSTLGRTLAWTAALPAPEVLAQRQRERETQAAEAAASPD